MILSHTHRFVFVKTHKTASTSIEVALGPLAGPDAVITPIGSHPDHHHQHHRGWFNPLIELPSGSARNAVATIRQLAHRRRFYHHMEARRIRARMRPARWRDYFSFCFERNPWDKAYSMYRFVVRRGRYQGSFEQFLFDPSAPLSDWGLYAVRNRIIVDRVFRYETLEHDFAEACRMVGLDPPALSVEKFGGLLPGAYREAYDDRLRDRVAAVFEREIEAFGYEF